MSILYIVGTPIGNLDDITFRSIDILKDVDLIAAEDTRHTKILLDRFDIKTPLTSYHKFNINGKTSKLIAEVKSGKKIALVSDAGMPGISDPGFELIREAIDNGIEVIPIPNTSAFLVALSVSGLNTNKFIFEGFLPVKSGEKKKVLERLSNEDKTLIFYEAPHRLIKTLDDIKSVLGDRRICVARELTKKFEEISRGAISSQIDKYVKKTPKGEFVLVIEGVKETKEPDMKEIKILLADMIKSGLSHKDAAKIISKDKNIPKNKLYKLSLEM